MVQQANLKMSATEEMHEFQLVHAIITQTQNLDGCDDSKKSIDESRDETNTTTTATASILHIDVVSTICQKFHTVASTNNVKRVVPTYMKNLMQQKRSTTKPKTEKEKRNSREIGGMGVASSSSSSHEHEDYHEKKICLPLDSNSNVQQKVLHFEQCAIQQLSVVTDALRSNLDEILPPNHPASDHHHHDKEADETGGGGGDAVVGGDYEVEESANQQQHQQMQEDRLHGDDNLRDMDDDSNPTSSSSSSPSPPHQAIIKPVQLTGRNLKRVPSERFQEMRKKVQRLMQHQYRGDEIERAASPEIEEDEATFLKSIRILLPAHNQDPCRILRLPDHALCNIFQMLDTKTLASLKMTCSDFNYIVNFYDVRGTDSLWTKDKRYIDDPCKQCRRSFTPGDQSMCRYHPKRYYADLPYGRSYWMCCLKPERTAGGCQVGIHDNHWLARPTDVNT